MPGVKKSNQKKGPPDDAPSGPMALQVRGRVPGFFDRTSLSCRKTGRIHAATLRAFLHPPAASYGDPEGQEPDQKPDQEPDQEPDREPNARRCGDEQVFCRSALVRDRPERCTAAPRSRTSALLQRGSCVGLRVGRHEPLFVGAHPVRERRPQGGLLGRGRAQGALLQGWRRYGDGGSILPLGSLWERTLCATNLRSGTPQRGCRAQGALPQTSRRGRREKG